ncbi:helix-turn-helix transcriptional regulator [Peptostreptococcus porci]|uniref:helix-turn-helix domain-containing protein n=1 Tax=Peptostreptococcus porci TaxID=2652282 RepID=UPI002A9100EA|nr:helix-turn-helix transcriptional regulator [Peptostreptococcus porci]MDY5436527.1 helix-turn-helix transcriptional regulator [Peptostreptococcus porci]
MSSDLGNKEIMAKNIKRYMDDFELDRKELASIAGVAYSTLSDWLNANKYPRIDKIEKMANYFGISKADLVEDSPVPNLSNTKKLSEKEELLLDKYNKLNDFGQTEAIKRVSELTEIDKYTRVNITTMAAHNDDNSEEQQELMMKDFEEMDKW